MAAEIIPGSAPLTSGTAAASMRPRRMAAEIVSREIRHCLHVRASMRPRRMAAEIVAAEVEDARVRGLQ